MNVENIVPERLPPRSTRPPSPHYAVLRDEVLQALGPAAGNTYVDATLGAGGHTEAILEVPGTRVIGLDRDEHALRLASSRLQRFGDRLQVVHGRFGEVADHLTRLNQGPVHGLVADVGLSSMQLDEANRGMSFRTEGPIDMRMDRSQGETAAELIARLDDEALASVIFRFGEERRSRRIARCIKQAQAQNELETTLDLRRAVIRAVGPARVGGVDPATRTFQALRVAVNGELDELTALLDSAPSIIEPGGVIAVISFHSLEDRLVKQSLRKRDLWQPLTKKPVVAGDAEMAENTRSRSAKLRAACRLSGWESSGGEGDDGEPWSSEDPDSAEVEA